MREDSDDIERMLQYEEEERKPNVLRPIQVT